MDQGGYPIRQVTKKVDQCYSQALQKLSRENKVRAVFNVFRSIAVIIYLIFHQSSTQPQPKAFSQITIFYFVALGFNLFCLCSSALLYFQFFRNKEKLYQVAEKIGHCQQVYEGQEDFYENPKLEGLLVCNRRFQFAQNILVSDVDQIYIKSAEKRCVSMIIQLDKISFYRRFEQLLSLISVGIFVFGLVILFGDTEGVSGSETTFMAIYLIIQALTRIYLYLILLLLCLSPIFCLGFCFYSCFCAKDERIHLPESTMATVDNIRECEGQCPICYQGISQNQKVIILRCSPKHIFHELCLKGWTQIGKTCPICRQFIH